MRVLLVGVFRAPLPRVVIILIMIHTALNPVMRRVQRGNWLRPSRFYRICRRAVAATAAAY